MDLIVLWLIARLSPIAGRSYCMNLKWKLLHEEEATEQKTRGPYRTETLALLYAGNQACVRVGRKLLGLFPISQGVKRREEVEKVES